MAKIQIRQKNSYFSTYGRTLLKQQCLNQIRHCLTEHNQV